MERQLLGLGLGRGLGWTMSAGLALPQPQPPRFSVSKRLSSPFLSEDDIKRERERVEGKEGVSRERNEGLTSP